MSPDRHDRRRTERVRADWSARFEAEGMTIIGYVTDLSRVSARMRPETTGAPPALPPGTTGTLTLSFPDVDARMEVLRITGTVVRAGLDGVAFTFAALPEPAARWLTARLLTGEARRRVPRLRIALPVQIQRSNALPVSAETKDLSAYGARIRSDLPLSAGDRLDLSLPLDSRRPPMIVRSVVWEVSGEDAVLMFVNLKPRDFNRIGDYVASRLGAQG